MSTFVNLLIVAIVFWGFIAAYMSVLTTRLQRMEKELTVLQTNVGPDTSANE